MWTEEAIVERMKREIAQDVTRGKIPTNISSFAQLHEIVDGNEYGGLCMAECPFDAGNDKDTHLINLCQLQVDRWLKTKPFMPIHLDVGALLARVSCERLGFFEQTDINLLASDEKGRLVQVLVRTGECRFICGAQDVEHLTRAIERVGDYVRDISIPAARS